MNRYEALRHAVKAHAGQKDRCGRDYILHPIAVAEAIEDAELGFGQEDAVVVALLHDVWEDTDYVDLDDALTTRQYHALALLTRLEVETYDEYIGRIGGERYRDIRAIAGTVKLADLHHNLQPERQACLSEKEQRSLAKRYLKARDRIWEALGHEWWPEPLEEGQGG